MTEPFLPYGRQCLDETDYQAVLRVLKSDFLTQGPEVERFEGALCERIGIRHAVSVCNGTAALHLAFLALGIGRGDTVIVPAISFVATANAVLYVGGNVWFADVDADTALMTPETLLKAYKDATAAGRNVRAVAPVHFAGQISNVSETARELGLLIVADACHAIGSTLPDGTGGDADLTLLSFHPVKTIAAGEGGAVLTNDDRFAERLRSFRSHGIVRRFDAFKRPELAGTKESPNPWYHEMHELGYNFRLSDLHAAIGRSQLKKLDSFVERRAHLRGLYQQALAGLAPEILPMTQIASGVTSWHLMVALIDFEALGTDRATVMDSLRAQEVGSQVHYIPIPWQPYYHQRIGEVDIPGAASYYARTLSLPLFPSMQESDVDRVVSALKNAIGIKK